MKLKKQFKDSLEDVKSGRIILVNLNQEKKGTCGSCHYTDNDLGIVALHCTNKKKEAKQTHWDEYGKVRSWNKCKLWRKRKIYKEV